MNWKVALSTSICLSQPLLEVLPRLKNAGFKLIEATALTSHLDYKDLDSVHKIRDEMDRLGMQTVSMHAPYSESIDLTMLRESDRKLSVEELLAAADALRVLGGTKLVVHAGSVNEDANKQKKERLKQSLHSLTEINNYCQKTGVELVIENMLGHLVGGREDELQWFLARLPRQNLGFCLDTGHAFLSGKLLKYVKIFAPYLALVHAHDNKGTYDDHLPPGEGKINWSQFLGALADAKFNGEIVIEVLSGKEDNSVLERTWQSICFLKDTCADKLCSINLEGG